MKMGRKTQGIQRAGFYALSALFHAGLLGGVMFLAGESRPAIQGESIHVRLSREKSPAAAPEKNTAGEQKPPPQKVRRAPEVLPAPAASAKVSARKKPAKENSKPPRPVKTKARPKAAPPRAIKTPSPAAPVREMVSFYPAGGHPAGREAAAPPPGRSSPKRKTAAALSQKAEEKRTEKKRTGKKKTAPISTASISTTGLSSPEAAPISSAPGSRDIRRILLQVADRIRRARRYPAAARRMGIEGTAVVSFRIRPEGGIRDVKIRKSSGHPLLDTASIDAVRRAAPLPYIRQALVIPIRYTLREADE